MNFFKNSGSDQLLVERQVNKDRSSDEVERFLSLIRFEQREKLEELPIDYENT